MEELREYLGHPELAILYNSVRFDKLEFSDPDQLYARSGSVYLQHIDKYRANWGSMQIVENLVTDTSGYFHYSQGSTQEVFENLVIQPLGRSYEDFYPSFYKIAGYSIFRNLDQNQITRKTYDLLDYGKDLGGLDRVLMIVTGLIAFRVQRINLRNQFIGGMYLKRTRPKH